MTDGTDGDDDDDNGSRSDNDAVSFASVESSC